MDRVKDKVVIVAAIARTAEAMVAAVVATTLLAATKR
jgi:hypothetical protein